MSIRTCLLVMLWSVALSWFALFSVALAAPRTPGEEAISFKGKLFCSLRYPVTFTFDGEIKETKVREGDKIMAGDTIITYKLTAEGVGNLRGQVSTVPVAKLEAQLAKIDGKIKTYKEVLRELDTLPKDKDVAELRKAKPQQALAALEADRAAVVKRIELARKNLDEQVRVLRDVFGELIDYDKAPEVVPLKSPSSGFATAFALGYQPGGFFKGGQEVMSICTMDPMLARAHVYESEYTRLKQGDNATLRLDSLPGERFTGQIARITHVPGVAELNRPTYYEVEITVPNPQIRLKEGLMTTITVGE